MPRRPAAPALAPVLRIPLAPTLLVGALSMSGCIDPGSVPGSASDTDATTTGDVEASTGTMSGATASVYLSQECK